MKCEVCKTEDAKSKNMCDSCRLKKWRKDNPDKIKAYLERTVDKKNAYYEKNRDKIKKGIDAYYANNREEIARKKRIKNQKTNYEYDRVESTKRNKAVRSETNKKFPLAGEKCVKCGVDAEQHHHTTKPIVFDKFIFICEKCHNPLHGRRNFKKSACYTRKQNKEVKECQGVDTISKN